MKKKLILTPLIGALVFIIMSGYSEGPAITGSINGTGSTGTTGCSCHNPSATTATTVLLELYDATGTTLVTGGYVGGTTYKIKITGAQTNTALTAFGFQLAIVKSAGAGTGSAVNAGTMSAAPSGTHIYALSGINILEHYNGGSYAAIPGVLSGGVQNYAQSITWTAPVAGTGSVKVYGTINAVDGSHSAGAPDSWNNSVLTIPEAATVAAITGTMSVCVNGTTQLSDATSGGTWTSASTGVATIDNATGLVTGVSAGTSVISYNTTIGTAVATVTVNPLPNAGSITGASSVCTGVTIPLSDVATGGTWLSSNNAVATVNSSGTVTGVSAGTVNITYSVTNSCGTATALHAVTVNPAPNAGTITSGTSSICVITTSAFSDAIAGGTWSSGNTSFATVSNTGVVTGVAAGSLTLSYSVTNSCGTAVATMPINITTAATAGTITGPAIVCTGSTINLSDAITGGVWSSGNTAVATVTSGGVVTGITTGSVNISYAVSSSCGAAATGVAITVNLSADAGSISGAHEVCIGAVTSLTDAAAGGIWSSSNTGIATIGLTGDITGVAAGTAAISYTVSNSCGAVSAVHTFTVSPPANAGIITGPDSVCIGQGISLSNAAAGGVWSATNSIATVSPIGFVQGGFSAGIDTIRYTVTNICGSVSVEKVIKVGIWPICEGAVGSVDEAGQRIHVYPNPSNGTITIELPVTNDAGTITVSDMTGRVIRTQTILPGAKQVSFALGNVATGSYVLKVCVGNMIFREKILIK